MYHCVPSFSCRPYSYYLSQVYDHGQTDNLGTSIFYYELRPPTAATAQPGLKCLWLTTDRDPRQQLRYSGFRPQSEFRLPISGLEWRQTA